MLLFSVSKYLIFEQCLNTFFGELEKNVFSKKSKRVPEVGERFRKIISLDKSEIFYHCVVLSVDLEDGQYYIEIAYLDYDSIDNYNEEESMDLDYYPEDISFDAYDADNENDMLHLDNFEFIK